MNNTQTIEPYDVTPPFCAVINCPPESTGPPCTCGAWLDEWHDTFCHRAIWLAATEAPGWDGYVREDFLVGDDFLDAFNGLVAECVLQPRGEE